MKLTFVHTNCTYGWKNSTRTVVIDSNGVYFIVSSLLVIIVTNCYILGVLIF